jgi:hypothetical protein
MRPVSIIQQNVTARQFDDIDAALFAWFCAKANGVDGLSGLVLQEKANSFAIQLGYPVGDTIGPSWINRWKTRHGIVAKRMHGEAAAVPHDAVDTCKSTVLQDILKEYKLQDKFNCDELGLFWRLLPEQTHVFKHQKCSGGKKSKDRVTVLVGASATGMCCHG